MKILLQFFHSADCYKVCFNSQHQHLHSPIRSFHLSAVCCAYHGKVDREKFTICSSRGIIWQHAVFSPVVAEYLFCFLWTRPSCIIVQVKLQNSYTMVVVVGMLVCRNL